MAKKSGTKNLLQPQPKKKYRYDYFPSFSKIVASFNLRSREYLRENTLHGFQYFVDPRRPYWERVAWFLCTLASICAVIGIIFSIMGTAWKNPSLTALDSDTEHLRAYFPSVALCQKQPDFDFSLYSKGETQHFLDMYNWSWSSVPESPSSDIAPYSEIFNLSTPSCDALYPNCSYSGSNGSNNSDDEFEKVIFPRGVCCVKRAIEMKRADRPWDLFFMTTAYPISLDIVEHSGLPLLRDSPSWYYLTDGINLRIALQHTYISEEMESMSISSRECLLPEEGFSYEKCQYNCQKKAILQTCGCLPWFLINIEENERECLFREYECLVANKQVLKNVRCPCYLSCNHTFYYIAQPDYASKDGVSIEIFDFPEVLYVRNVRFGLMDLLVSFGGIAGLFLGYSVLTTVEFFYYFLLRTYCGAFLAQDNTIKVKVAKTSAKKKKVKVVPIEQPYYDYFE